MDFTVSEAVAYPAGMEDCQDNGPSLGAPKNRSRGDGGLKEFSESSIYCGTRFRLAKGLDSISLPGRFLQGASR